MNLKNVPEVFHKEAKNIELLINAFLIKPDNQLYEDILYMLNKYKNIFPKIKIN